MKSTESEAYVSKEAIAIIGGTGKEGKGLAYRWIKAGYPVIIGSRNEEKAQNAVHELLELFHPDEKPNISLTGSVNQQAVMDCKIAVLTIPYEYHESMLQELKVFLADKFFVDVTVPLVPPKVSIVKVPPYGSAALHAQNILGNRVKVISAFQNISFELLLSNNNINCDVLVCGVDEEARSLGLRLVEDAGLRGWDAGPLENSIVQEGLTSILIRINKKFGIHSAGIQITGTTRE